MAPLPADDIPDSRSSNQDLSISLSPLSLTPPLALPERSNAVSPLEAGSYLATRNSATSNPPISHGNGSFDPHNVNNRGILALFGIIGLGMVLASIWFFFWAKNGGFVWRKRDWDDYKSTVLRRKGPNGTTLSGATKTTDLGGGSVVPEIDRDDETIYLKKGAQRNGRKAKLPRGKKNGHDHDVRAYRHEKVAKVGGLNREADGSYHTDYANTEYTDFGYTEASDISQQSIHNEKRQYSHAKHTTPKKQSGAFYAHTPSSTDSHRPLRPNAARPGSRDSTPTRSRQSSPRKHTTNHKRTSNPSIPGSFGNYTEPLDFESRYTASEADTDGSRGTKAYFHPIPGLGAGAGSAGGYTGPGFRRGGAGRRRDSLSDSEGEETVRS